MNYKNITSCRLCKRPDLKILIGFGDIALANSYLNKQSNKEDKYPLTLVQCSFCGHVQLKETVNPSILFSNYLYSSSDSPALVKHFEGYAQDVVSEFQLGENTHILEIGSNSGVLLNEFKKLGLDCLLGVEPASNLVDLPSNKHLDIHKGFFNHELAVSLKESTGTFDVITSNNTFAHIADLDSVMNGIDELLAKDGIFVFENAYWPETVKVMSFDNAYHEHLQYFTIHALSQYLSNWNLKIFKVKFNKIQGGSFRAYVKRNSCEKYKIDDSVSKTIETELLDFGLLKDHWHKDFSQNIDLAETIFGQFLTACQANDKSIACYGSPAKFALFSKWFGLDFKNVKYVVDDSPLKQGKFSPEGRIPIVSRQYFIENPCDFTIISAWNFAESIKNNNSQYKGKWILPLPTFKIL